MIYDEPIPEIRAIDQPYAALAAAVAEMAIADLTNPHPHTRRTATAFVRADTFATWIELAGLNVEADECRRALQRRGVLPS
jgi:hypothetical protein